MKIFARVVDGVVALELVGRKTAGARAGRWMRRAGLEKLHVVVTRESLTRRPGGVDVVVVYRPTHRCTLEEHEGDRY